MKTYRSESLTIDEQKRLLDHAASFEDLVLFKLALQSGIRREDITKIEIGNIDLEGRKITFWEAKKKRFWTIPITENMALEIKRYLATVNKGQRRLFTFTGRTAYNRLQETLKRAGISKKLSFHDLRRTMIKTAKKRGISDKAIQQITGDTQKVLQRHYENLDHDELKEELEKI